MTTFLSITFHYQQHQQHFAIEIAPTHQELLSDAFENSDSYTIGVIPLPHNHSISLAPEL